MCHFPADNNHYFVCSVRIVLRVEVENTLACKNAPHAKNVVHCIK